MEILIKCKQGQWHTTKTKDKTLTKELFLSKVKEKGKIYLRNHDIALSYEDIEEVKLCIK